MQIKRDPNGMWEKVTGWAIFDENEKPWGDCIFPSTEAAEQTIKDCRLQNHKVTAASRTVIVHPGRRGSSPTPSVVQTIIPQPDLQAE